MKGTAMNIMDDVDWQGEWRRLQRERRPADNATYWDGRAPKFAEKASSSLYVSRFLEYMDIRDGEQVFDMGCGSGALTIPLAEDGHEVIAADFSRGMIDVVDEELRTREITTVKTKVLSWEDDWPAAGILPRSVDVALASRSIAVADLGKALQKLNDVARRKVYLTIASGDSPRNDRLIYEVVGRNPYHVDDFIYCMNILFQWGIHPELRYIDTHKSDSFESYDAAFESYRSMLRNTTAEEERLLRQYLDEHLVFTDADQNGRRRFEMDHQRIISWAFISWETWKP